jgi:hypothetical protein
MRYGLVLIFIAAFSSLVESLTQQTREGKKEDSIIVCDYTCLAIIYVKVIDRGGKEVLTLRREDFTIYEDGVRQEIESLLRNDNYIEECRQARYQLGYYPINENFDGKYRKITVTVQTKDGKKWKAQVFPKGYHAILLNKKSEQVGPHSRCAGGRSVNTSNTPIVKPGPR